MLKRRPLRSFVFALLLAMCTVKQTRAGAPDHFALADEVRLLDCEPAGPAPCFRMKLNIVDANGDPAPAELGPVEQLPGHTSILLEGQPLTPFYVQAQNASSSVRGRVALILVDISGSMNTDISPGQSRFAAAQNALRDFLSTFQDGVDEVAIVPFESHNVLPAIQAARFSISKTDAQQQVDQLPVPAPHNNTALYSAVNAGLDVLAGHVNAGNGSSRDREVMLIVMTDGKNEVFKGDDPGLLDGPAGLETASRKVHSSAAEVIGIGFGDPAGIDRAALTSLSTKVYMAPDAETLRRSFTIARTLLNSRILVTFNSSIWKDRASLAGRTLRMTASMKLASGQTISSRETTWAAPAMGMPVFDGKCSDSEREALFRMSTPDRFNWLTLLRPLAVFLSIALLLLVLWFWLPRLIWQDQYSGLEQELQRWQAPAKYRGTNTRNAPPGFTSMGKTGPDRARTPSDATTVQPQTGITKTRLG